MHRYVAQHFQGGNQESQDLCRGFCWSRYDGQKSEIANKDSISLKTNLDASKTLFFEYIYIYIYIYVCVCVCVCVNLTGEATGHASVGRIWQTKVLVGYVLFTQGRLAWLLRRPSTYAATNIPLRRGGPSTKLLLA